MRRVAIIGVGHGGKGVGGHSIGRLHARSYLAEGGCKMFGVADLSPENLEQFAAEYGVEHTNTDVRSMLAEVRPEIVSVATYVGSHRKLIAAAVEAGAKGVWCEKPFVLNMEDGRAAVEMCERAGVKLVVNHQRRYLHLFQEARKVLNDGEIGTPVQLLATVWEWDIIEWGTHWFDMFRYLLNDQPVRWVSAQVRCTGEKTFYGHLIEEHAVAQVCFQDGTRALLEGGEHIPGDAAIKIVGTEGVLDILNDGTLRLINARGVRDVEVRSDLHFPLPGTEAEDAFLATLRALLTWVDGGEEPEVSGRNGLLSTELYLAAYESAKRGDRIDLPLTGQTEFPLKAVAARSAAGAD